VNSLVETPIQYEEAYLKKNPKDCRLEDMALKPKANETKKLVALRMLSVLCFIACILVIITQATALFAHKYSFLYFVKIKALYYIVN
jgi:hypothetical protein